MDAGAASVAPKKLSNASSDTLKHSEGSEVIHNEMDNATVTKNMEEENKSASGATLMQESSEDMEEKREGQQSYPRARGPAELPSSRRKQECQRSYTDWEESKIASRAQSYT